MRLFSAVWVMVFGLSAHAYHIEEHRTITTQAFHELIDCFPKAEAMLNLEWIASGNVEEDTDLFTKWMFYSHYYNLNKEIKMRRADSAQRVDSLASDLQDLPNEGISITEMNSVGHMIHHFQDATVPAHVIPVDHSLWDGYESYDAGPFSSGLTCSEIVTLTGDPLQILKETALGTLENIKNFHFDFVSVAGGDENRINASGAAFWQESSDSFGTYGYLGNNFGKTRFSVGRISYQVADESYRAFKAAQTRLAVQATIRGLMWEIGGALKKTTVACENI